MRTVEEKYKWLITNFQSHSLHMDGTRGFRFMNYVIGRHVGRSVDEVIEKAMDAEEADIEELKQKSERNLTEQYVLDTWQKNHTQQEHICQ
jgi:hypothetical protein